MSIVSFTLRKTMMMLAMRLSALKLRSNFSCRTCSFRKRFNQLT